MPDFIDIRCPECNRLLLQVSGNGCILKIKCSKCGVFIGWPMLVPEILFGNGDLFEKAQKMSVGVGT